MSDTVTAIMSFADAKLKGSGLSFALVLWKPGCPNGLKSVGISTLDGMKSDEVLRALTLVSAPLIGADPNQLAAKVLNDAAQRSAPSDIGKQGS